MPIETVDDIIEQLADEIGIYGVHVENESKPCRCCWTSSLRQHLDSAYDFEEFVKRGVLKR